MTSNLRFFGNLIIFMTGIFYSTSLSLQNEMAIAQQPNRHKYPTEFVSDYMKDCHNSVVARDIPPEEANTLCKCTLSQFQSKYSLAEFQTLVKNSKNDKKAASQLTEVGNACFEQILYEQ